MSVMPVFGGRKGMLFCTWEMRKNVRKNGKTGLTILRGGGYTE